MKKSVSKAKALLSILLVLAMIVPTALPSYAATRVNGNSKAAVEDLETKTNEAGSASEQSSQEALGDDSAQITDESLDAVSEDRNASEKNSAKSEDAAEKDTEEGEELQSLDDLFMDFSGTSYPVTDAEHLSFTYRNGCTGSGSSPSDVYDEKKIMITEVNSPVADPYTSSFGIDSDHDFSFIVSPYVGYELPDNYIKSIIYDKYTSASDHTEKKLSFSSFYAVDIEDSYYKNKGYRKGSKLVTLPSSLLKSIESNVYTSDNGAKYGRNIVLELGQASPTTYTGITVTAEAEDGIKLKSYSSSLLYTAVDQNLSVHLSKLISNMEEVNPANLAVKVTVYDSSNNILNSFTRSADEEVKSGSYMTDYWCGIDSTDYTLNVKGDFTNLYGDNCSVVIDLTGRSSSTYYPIESSMDTELVSACKLLRTDNQDGSFRYTLTESDKKAYKGEDLYVAFYSTKKRVIEAACQVGNKTVGLIPVTDYDEYTAKIISGSSGKYIDLYKIEAAEIADKVTLSAKTKEYVKLQQEKNNYAAFTGDGSEITTIYGAAQGNSYEDLNFFIIPADGYEVDNVTYKTDNSSSSKSLVASPDLMSIPANAVNSTVYISSTPEYISVRGEEVSINTKYSSSLYTANAVSLDINDDIVTTPFSIVTALTAKGHIGEPFYFQIQGSNTTDLNTVVNSLWYEMDGKVDTLTPIAVTPAVIGEGGIKQDSVYWYVIPELTGDVLIDPSAKSGNEIVTLTSPKNENIYFYIDEKLLEKGESVEVVKGTKVKIEVAALGSKETSTVKLSDFGYLANGKTYYYNSGMADPSKSDFKDGSWDYPANYDTTFFAWTNEYVNSDNFVTVFDGPDIEEGTEGLDEKGIAAISTTDEKGNALALSGVNTKELATMVNAQSALLSVSAVGNTDAKSDTHNQSFNLSDTKIYPYMSPDKDYLGSPIDGELTIEIENESDGKYAGAYLDSYVYGIKPGNASAVAKLTVNGKTVNKNSYGEMTDSDYNRLIYTADSDETKTNGRLAIKVVDHYDSIGIYSDTDNIYAATESSVKGYNVAKLWVRAHDNITDTTVVLDAYSDPSIEYIDWTFDPDTRYNEKAANVFCTSEGGELEKKSDSSYLIAPYEIYEARSGSEDGENKYVYVKSSDDEDIVVNASIYIDGNSTPFSSLNKTIVVSEKDEDYFAVLRMDPASGSDLYDYGIPAAPETLDLGLGDHDPKTVVFTYDVYRKLTNTSANESSNENAIKSALAAGEIELVEKNVSYGSPDFSQDFDRYLEYDGTNAAKGEWTITSKAKTTGSDYPVFRLPEVFVNGVMIRDSSSLEYEIAVYGTLEDKYRLNLITYNKDSENNVNEVTLTDSYTSFVQSNIKGDSINSGLLKSEPEYGKIIGTSITDIGKGMSLTLPYQSDLTGDIPSDRVLVGWAEMAKFYDGTSPDLTTMRTEDGAGLNSTVSSTGSSYILAPGDRVIMDGSYSYRAIWIDKCRIEGIYNKNLPTTEADGSISYNVEFGAMGLVEGLETPGILKILRVDGLKGSGNEADSDLSKATLNFSGEVSYEDNFTFSISKGYESYSSSVSINKNKVKGLQATNGNILSLTAEFYDTLNDYSYWTADTSLFEVTKTYSSEIFFRDASGNYLSFLELEKGAAPEVITPVLMLTYTGASSAKEFELNDSDYSITFTSDSSKVIVASNETNKVLADIYPNEITTDAIVTCTVRDPNGFTTSETLTVDVVTPEYTMDIIDPETGLETGSIDAQIGQNDTHTEDAGSFLVRVQDSTGTLTTGTLEVSTLTGEETEYLKAEHEIIENKDKSITVNIHTQDDKLGSDTLKVSFTPSGKTKKYEKEIIVRTYAAIRFNAEFYEGERYTALKGYGNILSVNGSQKSTYGDADASVDLKLYSGMGIDSNNDGFTDKFNNIDISGYKVVYKKASSSSVTKSFDKWTDMPNYYTDNISLSLSDMTYGKYELYPVVSQKVTIDGLEDSYTLNDNMGHTYVSIENVLVGPVSGSGDGVLKFSTDQLGLFKAAINGTAAIVNESPLLPSQAATYSDGKNANIIKFEKITDTAKAGVATLSFYIDNQYMSPAKVVKLYIDGLNYDTNTGKRSYYESGVPVKSTKKTITASGSSSDTYYFDETGSLVVGSGTYLIDDDIVLLLKGDDHSSAALSGVQTNSEDGRSYYVGSNGVIKRGWLDSYGQATTAAYASYYGDPSTGELASDLTKIGDIYYYFNINTKVLQRAKNTLGYYENTGFGLYVNAAGEVAFSKLVTIDGKNYLIDKNGGMVTYQETISAGSKGYYTLNGTRYIINTDNTAEEEEKFCIYGDVVFEDWPEGYDYTNVPTTIGASVKVYSENNYTSTVDLPVTISSSPAKITASTTEFTLTAKADLSKYYTDKKFTEKASYVVKTEDFVFKNGKAELADIKYIYKKPKFEWPKTFTKDNLPSVYVTYTLYSVEEKKALDPVVEVVTAEEYSTAVDGNKKVFKATIDLSKYYTDETGTTHVSPTQYVSYKTYKIDASGGGSLQAESPALEDNDERNWNLFYKRDSSYVIDTEGAVPSLAGAKGNWQKYFDIEISGDLIYVDLKEELTLAQIKRAAQKANSTIVLPLMNDDETAVVGQLNYRLPVSYEAPVIKLSSQTGTIHEYGGEQILKTFVTVKKSTGVYVPLDLSTQVNYVGLFGVRSGSSYEDYPSEAGELTGEVDITASTAAKGYINVQLENWNGTVTKPYNIRTSKKMLISGEKNGKPCSQITLNNKIGKYVGTDQSIDILINGSTDYYGDTDVYVTEPKDYMSKGGFTVEGIEDGMLSDTTLTFSYPEDPSTMTPGSYTFTFKTGDGASFKLKVVVSGLNYDKLIDLKIKTKYDIITGQKMVVVPTLKGMDGQITDVQLIDEKEVFEAYYDEDSNQIIIEPVDDGEAPGLIAAMGSTYTHKTVIIITVDDVVCRYNLNFNVTKKAPALRTEAISIAKSALQTGDGISECNISSIFKLPGATVHAKPVSVYFMNSDNEADEDGFIYERKTKTFIRYNPDQDNFVVIPTAATEAGTIKTRVYYANRTKIDKNIKLVIDNRY